MTITSKEVCSSCKHDKKDCKNKYAKEDDRVIACQWYEEKE